MNRPKIILLIFTMGIFSNLFGQKLIDQKTISEQVELKIEPSNLLNFGGKSIWIAVKSNSTKQVLSNLKLLELEKTNWMDGIKRVISFSNYKDVFVTEPFDGWVLIIGWGLPTPLNTGIEDVENFLNKLSIQFGEAQYFASQRTTDSACWISSRNGKVERAYSISDGISFITGKPTQIEKNYRFVDFNSPVANSDEYFENNTYPDLKVVSEIAESWSINPLKIEEFNSEKYGIGYIAKLKQK